MKVFISHSSETTDLARELSEALTRAGLEAWNHEQEILPGDNWAKKIGQALDESQAMVVLLSPGSLDSTTVRREIEYALGRKQFKNRLIPVFVGSEKELDLQKLPWILSHLNVIKLPAYDKQEEGINRITEALQAVA
ncbi:MAG TPA: toll/interleukin-1 receptor domain-containing protein [Pyrinomonadaceae bacterium]|nr:toll/interleukin-1 receptor domain-containing protein [Pyrinomonadaceae bacterium]